MRQQSEKINKLRESSELKQKNLLKSKENEEKQFQTHLSKFVENFIKKDEALKSNKLKKSLKFKRFLILLDKECFNELNRKKIEQENMLKLEKIKRIQKNKNL